MATVAAFPPPPGVLKGFQAAGIRCCVSFRLLWGSFPSPTLPTLLQGSEAVRLAPKRGLSLPLSLRYL